MQTNIFTQKPKEALPDFLNLCKAMGIEQVNEIQRIAITTVQYLSGSSRVRTMMREGQDLENRWYNSLESGSPDWAVYGTDYYLAELWACWMVYSRKYLRDIQNPTSLFGVSIYQDIGEVKRVIDLGCGIGYTCAGLKAIYPTADVIGTNLEGTRQTEFARYLGIERGFRVLPDIHHIAAPVDLIFASEYFEHIINPVDHLFDVLDKMSPRILIIANSFGTRAIGHFDLYHFNGYSLNGKETSRRFNQALRQRGYDKIKTHLWNSRPAYWKRRT